MARYHRAPLLATDARDCQGPPVGHGRQRATPIYAVMCLAGLLTTCLVAATMGGENESMAMSGDKSQLKYVNLGALHKDKDDKKGSVASAAVEDVVGGERPEGSESMDNLELASKAEDKGYCQSYTGGTCIVSKCFDWRNATCEHSLCACDEGSCSDVAGVCQGGTAAVLHPSVGSRAWARDKMQWVFYLMWVSIPGRADVVGAVFTFLMTTGLFGPSEEGRKREYKFGMTWKEAMQMYGYGDGLDGWILAIAVASLKLVVMHLLQPVAFVAALYAYAPLIGWWQWLAAVVICLREVIYLSSVAVGAVMAPSFLLFAPLSENHKRVVFVYVSNPCYFVLRHFDAPADLLSAAFLVAAADLSAVVAFAACLSGSGSAFPPLVAGYAVSVLAVISFALVFVDELLR